MVTSAPETALPTIGTISDAQVEAYLRSHPSFLSEHPRVLSALTPPALRTGEDVLDMQRFMIERLRRETEALRDNHSELVDRSRVNMLSQASIHSAVVHVLEARTFEHLLEIVTGEFRELLDVDVATLCFEAAEQANASLAAEGVHTLQQGGVAELLGAARDVVLRGTVRRKASLFGGRAGSVRSDALIRLEVSRAAPPGLLALGSKDEARFHHTQGTELLRFLGDVLSRCLRTWLNLPG